MLWNYASEDMPTCAPAADHVRQQSVSIHIALDQLATLAIAA
jgi:hypothetical protein